MAYDMLAYLPPKTLISTIRKIYDALLPGGLFVGTFLVNRELKTDNDVLEMAKGQASNSYSYTNPAIVANILQLAGFQMEVCTTHNPFPDPLHPACIVNFVARK